MDKIELGERESPEYSVIWLHGLGADGNDFVPIIPELELPNTTHFVFPHAPYRPVTIYGGMPLRAWYDIVDISENGPVDATGIEESVVQVQRLIDAEITKGVNPAQIILAGFSQGGVIAMHAGLRYPQRLGGIIALSTYMPLSSQLEQLRHHDNQDTPVFVAHGKQDPLLHFKYGQAVSKHLSAWGYPVSWHEYDMAHAVCDEEVEDIAEWLKYKLTTA